MNASYSARRRESRVQWGLLAFVLLAVAAIGVVVLLLARGLGGSEEPYSLRSGAPSGLLGLRLWLEETGYQVQVGRAPEVATEAAVIFLFPDADLTADQVRRLAERVAEGRTLVLAGAESLDLSRTFGVTIQRSQPIVLQPLHQAQPLLPPAAALAAKRVSGRSLSAMPAAHLAPVLVAEDGKVAVLLERREMGAVWHVGIQGAFTNAELRDGWSRALAVAAVRGKPRGSTVYIVNGETAGPDAAPVRDRSNEIDGLGQWLVRQPLGWAVLLATAFLLFYLFTQGRRLGPPLVVADPHRRRFAVEHIQAMANLEQRAGHREGVARYQKARLKRRLGQTCRVSADLDDASFAAALSEQARLSPEKNIELRELLARFDGVKDEAALVELVEVAVRFSV